jgi:DNA-binding response OmpR family regulator
MNSILVLEDDPMIASGWAALLEERFDCPVLVARSVAEAVNLAGPGLKLALLDVEVSDGNSFQLAALMSKRHIPCIFVSGSDPSRLPEDLVSIPFFRKPVMPEELTAAVEAVLSKGD